MQKANLKKYINEYIEIKAEIADLKHRIKKQKSNSITKDVVSTSSGSPSYAKHNVIISGVDVKLNSKIKTYEKLLINAQIKLTNILIEIETEIQQIDDSLIRLLIRLRYIDNLTWQQIAFRIGKHDEQYPRKKINEFFNKYEKYENSDVE